MKRWLNFQEMRTQYHERDKFLQKVGDFSRRYVIFHEGRYVLNDMQSKFRLLPTFSFSKPFFKMKIISSPDLIVNHG